MNFMEKQMIYNSLMTSQHPMLEPCLIPETTQVPIFEPCPQLMIIKILPSQIDMRN